MSEIKKTSEIIKQMSKIAWDSHIKGDSLKRNSLLYPINTVFEQIRKQNQFLDLELVRASTIQKIFDYLDRINESEYKVGQKKREKITEFVDIFFDKLLLETYKNKINLILSDEKNLKAAYLFYINNQISKGE